MTAAERHLEPRPGMLVALAQIPRFLTTLAVAKHRLFVWMESPTLPDPQSFAFARAADYSFGLLQSRLRDVWALKQGTRLEPHPRYTPTICVESFPFPRPTPKQEATIAGAAKELNELREHWLNPPEWTEERILKFPGSIGGPWDRYIDKSKIVNPKSKIGQVRYPRLGPRDSDCAAKLKEGTLTIRLSNPPSAPSNAPRLIPAASWTTARPLPISNGTLPGTTPSITIQAPTTSPRNKPIRACGRKSSNNVRAKNWLSATGAESKTKSRKPANKKQTNHQS